MTEPVVFEKVSFSYPGSDRRVLAGVDLRIPEGAFVLVVGSTGSGKSTLLRAMNGLVPHFTGGAFSGRVVVEGRSTLDRAPRELADVIAFVPQEPESSFVLDRVEDELAYAMENLGVPPERMRRRVEETLDLLDIASLRDRSVRTLSGGERQRVAIAAALTAGPRLLVLDEPTSQLDPQGAEDVLAALQRLVHDLGMTVVCAEHRLERVAGFADLAVGCRVDRSPVIGDPAEVFEVVGIAPPVARLSWKVGWEPPALTVRSARQRAASTELGAPRAGARPEIGPNLLEASGAVAGYAGTSVLKDVELAVRAGEIVAVMGRNGSGKTTLLRCLAGLHPLDSGRVSLEKGSSPRPGVEVALCPQSPETVLFRDTVSEEVETTLRAAGRDQGATGLLADLGIQELSARHPRDLSSGQRLLVAVAAIAATGAPVLLLDEPTRGLDPEAKARLIDYLAVRSQRNEATVLVTHDVELVAQATGRVVLMAGGEVIADGSPEDVLGDSAVFAPQMTRVFGPGWLTVEQVASALESRPAARTSGES
ncbi:MAG: ATP-binding cassette domain-containing protein [Actinomycetota bacterium]|nr:ATP-binding cassette domain-containing protein [Actinomycetota bacterium]